MAKLLLLDFKYCQNNRAQWKNLRAFLKLLDTITGYLLFLFVFFIFLFVYLSIFSVYKFLWTTVNKNFSQFHNFHNFSQNFFQRCFPGGGCPADVLRIFGGVSVRGFDFNEVAKRLCWDRASALLFSCGFASCLRGIFLREHLSRTNSERRWLYILLLIYSFQ